MKRFLMATLLMFIGLNVVYAADDTFYYDKERVEDMWITKANSEQTRSAHPYKLKRRRDNTYIYCLEPFTLLQNDTEYIESNDFTKYGFTKEQVDRINMIIYYGYGYGNHTTDTWYGVTQYLVWKESDKEADIYFTNKKNGPKLDLYKDEINEIEALIQEHNKKPDFLKNYIVSTNQILTVDSNIDLNNYDIVTNLEYQVNGRQLLFKNLDVGEYEVKMVRKNNRFKTAFAMYYSKTSQNVIVPGYSPIYNQEYVFKIKVIEGNLKIQKLGKNDQIKLEGAKYGIYQDNELVTTLITDSNGIGTVNLPFGNYIVKELEAPAGYKLDQQEYEVTIDENNIDIEITLYDEEDIIPIPDTGLESHIVESVIMVTLGMSGLFYVKKKYYLY